VLLCNQAVAVPYFCPCPKYHVLYCSSTCVLPAHVLFHTNTALPSTQSHPLSASISSIKTKANNRNAYNSLSYTNHLTLAHQQQNRHVHRQSQPLTITSNSANQNHLTYRLKDGLKGSDHDRIGEPIATLESATHELARQRNRTSPHHHNSGKSQAQHSVSKAQKG